jgi:hypothetical protein
MRKERRRWRSNDVIAQVKSLLYLGQGHRVDTGLPANYRTLAIKFTGNIEEVIETALK